MKTSISFEELKAQGTILRAHTVRDNRDGEEGMVLELVLNGCTLECLHAASDIMVTVAMQTAMEDGKLDLLALAVNAAIIEHSFKKELLDRANEAGMMGAEGDEHARHQ